MHKWDMEWMPIPYNLRTRPHNMTMINKTKFLNDTDFIIRMLYKHLYWLQQRHKLATSH